MLIDQMFSSRENAPITRDFEVRKASVGDEPALARILNHARTNIAERESSLLSLSDSTETVQSENKAFFLAGPKGGAPTVALRCYFPDKAPPVYNPQRSFLCVQVSYTSAEHAARYGPSALDAAVLWAAALSKNAPIFVGCITWAHDEASRHLADNYHRTSSLKEDNSFQALFKINEEPAFMRAATNWYFTSSGEALKALKNKRSLDVKIRAATEKDVEEMVALSKTKRHEYAKYQPVFWRPALDAEEKQSSFFKGLLRDQNSMIFVSESQTGEIDGFVIGMPKGDPLLDPAIRLEKVLHIDDFAVAHNQLWNSVGRELLIHAVEAHHARNGAGGVVNVISGTHDLPKRQLIENLGNMRLLYRWDILPSGNLYSEVSP